jgi:hypothetical protein
VRSYSRRAWGGGPFRTVIEHYLTKHADALAAVTVAIGRREIQAALTKGTSGLRAAAAKAVASRAAGAPRLSVGRRPHVGVAEVVAFEEERQVE